MTISELQQQIDAWIAQHGVRYFSELTNLAVLMEEVGELARLLSRTYGEQSFRQGLAPPDLQSAIADEMADVLFVLACLANQMNIDLTDAIKQNLEKKTNRDQQRHQQNPKLR